MTLLYVFAGLVMIAVVAAVKAFMFVVVRRSQRQGIEEAPDYSCNVLRTQRRLRSQCPPQNSS
jgi:hypothetical protein